MGTRNLTMVISNGKTKVAQYGQWDGYPSGQGKTILATLRRIDAGAEWGRFQAKIDSLKWLTKQQAAKVDKDKEWDINYPYLSRDCCGQILDAIYYGTMEVNTGEGKRKEVAIDDIIGLSDGSDFAGDSLFCEWAYVIDLDKKTFEIYRGFNQTPLTENDRFFSLFHQPEHRTDTYYPVKLLKSYSLDKLPTYQKFIKELAPNEVED